MTTRDALGTYFERCNVKPHDESVEQWLGERWAYMTLRGCRIPVKPLYGYKPVVVVHDVHHLLTGYDTTWTGEFEVAAWELGSGDCDRYLLMWVNRLLTLLMGLLFGHDETRRAFRRGKSERSLHAFECRSILACNVDELRIYSMGGARPPGLVSAAES